MSLGVDTLSSYEEFNKLAMSVYSVKITVAELKPMVENGTGNSDVYYSVKGSLKELNQNADGYWTGILEDETGSIKVNIHYHFMTEKEMQREMNHYIFVSQYFRNCTISSSSLS